MKFALWEFLERNMPVVTVESLILWSLVVVGVVVVLSWVMRRIRGISGRYEQCFHCHQYSLIPVSQLNKWHCQNCEGYNGFNEDGDYNVDLGQHDQRDMKPFASARNTNFAGSTLCHICNENQAKIVQAIAAFEPTSESRYSKEFQEFRARLDQQHPLCASCVPAVDDALERVQHKLDRRWLGARLLQSDPATIKARSSVLGLVWAVLVHSASAAAVAVVGLVALSQFSAGLGDPEHPAPEGASPPACWSLVVSSLIAVATWVVAQLPWGFALVDMDAPTPPPVSSLPHPRAVCPRPAIIAALALCTALIVVALRRVALGQMERAQKWFRWGSEALRLIAALEAVVLTMELHVCDALRSYTQHVAAHVPIPPLDSLPFVHMVAGVEAETWHRLAIQGVIGLSVLVMLFELRAIAWRLLLDPAATPSALAAHLRSPSRPASAASSAAARTSALRTPTRDLRAEHHGRSSPARDARARGARDASSSDDEEVIGLTRRPHPSSPLSAFRSPPTPKRGVDGADGEAPPTASVSAFSAIVERAASEWTNTPASPRKTALLSARASRALLRIAVLAYLLGGGWNLFELPAGVFRSSLIGLVSLGALEAISGNDLLGRGVPVVAALLLCARVPVDFAAMGAPEWVPKMHVFAVEHVPHASLAVAVMAALWTLRVPDA